MWGAETCLCSSAYSRACCKISGLILLKTESAILVNSVRESMYWSFGMVFQHLCRCIWIGKMGQVFHVLGQHGEWLLDLLLFHLRSHSLTHASWWQLHVNSHHAEYPTPDTMQLLL